MFVGQLALVDQILDDRLALVGRDDAQLLQTTDHLRWNSEGGKGMGVEQFMKVYYRWALSLGQLNEVLIQNFDQLPMLEKV